MNIKKELLKYEAKGMFPKHYTIWEKAQNSTVQDHKKKNYIDFTSTIFVANIGHGNRSFVNSLIKTIKKPLIHSYNNPHKLRLKYSKSLINFLGEKNKRVILLSGGSETTECALKLMRVYGSKIKKKRLGIITLKGNWHGRTMGSQMMSDNEQQKKWIGFKDPNIFFLDFPYPWKKNYKKNFFLNSLKKLKNKINFKKDICGIMLETFQGWGAIFYPKNYIKDISNFCKKNKILLCFDEMQSGFGRTGKKFGYMHYNVKPNIICCGKGMGSGFPLSGVIGDKKVINISPQGTLGSTHSGNPLACAAGLATLNELKQKKLIQKSKILGNILQKKLNEIKIKNKKYISSIQGKGLIAAIILKTKNNNLYGTKVANQIWNFCKMNGLLLVNTGRESIKIGPPLTISKKNLLKGIEILNKAFTNLNK